MTPLISTKIHAVLDYVMGAFLIATPWLFGFAGLTSVGTWICVILGAAVIVYSLLTRYEGGLLPVIPMRGHLALDFVSGALLAVSPWLLGFASVVFLPHLILGLMEVAASLLTSQVPGHIPARHIHRHA